MTRRHPLSLCVVALLCAPLSVSAKPAFAKAVGAKAAPAPTPTVVHTDPRPLQSCLPAAQGEVWVGGHGGLLRIDRRGKVLQHLTSLSGLPGTRVHTLFGTRDQLLVGTEQGLALLAPSEGRWKVIARRHSAAVHALARHAGAVYVGTQGKGVYRLDSLDADGLTSMKQLAGGRALRVTALLADGATLRVASAGRGLWRLAKSGLERQALTPALPSPLVFSLARFGGKLIVGTLGGVVSDGRLIDAADVRALRVFGGTLYLASFGSGLGTLRAGEQAVRWSQKAGRFVAALGLRGKDLCAAGRKKVVRLRAGAAVSTTPRIGLGAGLQSNNLSALAAVGETLYLGSYDGGLAALRRGRSRVLHGADPRIDALVAERRPDGGHRLYVGTARGLFRLDLPAGGANRRHDKIAVRRFGRADGLPHQHIHALVRLRDGRIAAGTGRGLAILDGDRVHSIGSKQGLFVSAVWALAEGEGDALWLGTSKGLYRWSSRRRRALRFSVASGHLSDDWVTALTRHGSAIYVGTYNAGVVRLALRSAPHDDNAATSPAATARKKKVSALARWQSTRLGGGWINFAGLQVVAKRWLLASTMSGLRATPLDPQGKVGPQTLFPLANAALGVDVTAALPTHDGRSLWIASRRGLVRQPLSILPASRDPDGC